MYFAHFLHESADGKPHDVVVIADDPADKYSAAALNSVAASFVAVLACGDVISDLAVTQRIKCTSVASTNLFTVRSLLTMATPV